MQHFDPNGAAQTDSGLIGLPFTTDEAALVVVPVPWDATSSRLQGSAASANTIVEASKYVELYDTEFKNIVYTSGISLADAPEGIAAANEEAKRLASPLLWKGSIGNDPALQEDAMALNTLCEQMNASVEQSITGILNRGKIAVPLGGEHSVSLGSIRAYLQKYPAMGVLQIDAHCDLREVFEGCTYSHGSVMHNVLRATELPSLVQAGVRGICEAEWRRTQGDERVRTFFDRDLAQRLARGENWQTICKEIAGALPQEVYVSLDVDGLLPSLFPHTGTPVPGGLSFRDVQVLLQTIVESGKRIVGFDLVEIIAPSWKDVDANNGAYLLYQLAGWCLRSTLLQHR